MLVVKLHEVCRSLDSSRLAKLVLSVKSAQPPGSPQFPAPHHSRESDSPSVSKPDGDISINRDGELFGYVLKYLQDKKVELPVTVPKAALLSEMKYFGIEAEKAAINALKHNPLFFYLKDYEQAANKRDEERNEMMAIYIAKLKRHRTTSSSHFQFWSSKRQKPGWEA
eukprot:GHVN01042856.1.p1 GENE.GHVN01042856.1~~GHVN01042856.1.p1  ORF type:complete len:168 (-),score=26.96 GHVN01042856.1:1023-1526(-)